MVNTVSSTVRYTEGWGEKCSEILATIKLLYNPRVNKVFNSIQGHFLKYCCCHNTCEKQVPVISTFPQPAQVMRWSLDFLPPSLLFLAPKCSSSYNLHYFLKSFSCSLYWEINRKVASLLIQKPFLLSTASALFPAELYPACIMKLNLA